MRSFRRLASIAALGFAAAPNAQTLRSTSTFAGLRVKGAALPASAAIVGATAAVPPPQSSRTATARRLPGFVAGAAPAADDAQAHERNRRFLQAVQARLPAR